MTSHEPRHDGGAIPGSAPSENISTVVSFAPLRFDAHEFMHFVEDEAVTESQATELLFAVWQIIVGVVDVAYGLSPVQQAVDRSAAQGKSRRRGTADVISSPLSVSSHIKSKTIVHRNATTVATEDS